MKTLPNMSSQSVHPLYDTDARLWVTESGVEAPTLAILQNKLPGVEIKGYFPQGFVAERPPRDVDAPIKELRAGLRTNYGGANHALARNIIARGIDLQVAKKAAAERKAAGAQSKPLQPKRPSPKTNKASAYRERVLMMRAKGMRVEDIAKMLHCSAMKVWDICTQAKREGDTRALKGANYHRRFEWTESRDKLLETLAERNQSAAQIATALDPTGHLTRSAVIGRAHRKGVILHGRIGLISLYPGFRNMD